MRGRVPPPMIDARPAGVKAGDPAVSRLLVAYLAVTLIPLFAAGVTVPRFSVGLAHLLAIAVLLARGREWSRGLREGAAGEDAVPSAAVRRGTPHLLAWFPLLLVPALYAELPLLNQLRPGVFHDPVVLGWERAIFGGNPAQSWAGALPSRTLSELLHASYLSYYLIIFVPPALLYLRRRFDEFEETVLAVMLVFVLCFAVFIVFPVQGPRYLFPAPEGVPDGFFRGLVLRVLEGGSSRGAAFPSSHMAVATVHFVMALRFQPRTGVVIGILTAGLGAGAVYGGFHYAIDMVAGAAAGLAVGLLLPRFFRRPEGEDRGLASSPSGA
jgi:hypothetical protein